MKPSKCAKLSLFLAGTLVALTTVAAVVAHTTAHAARECLITETGPVFVTVSSRGYYSRIFGEVLQFSAQTGIGDGSTLDSFEAEGSPAYVDGDFFFAGYNREICGDLSTPARFVYGNQADGTGDNGYSWLITWRPDRQHEAHLGERCPVGSPDSLGEYQRRTYANVLVTEHWCRRTFRVVTGGRICFDVAGSPGDMALVNLTPTSASAWGYGVLVSSDVPEPPNASNVNFDIGTLDPNVAAAPIGADGKVCYENSPLASVHLTADHLGTINAASFARATPTGASLRTLDTRNGAPVSPGGRICFDVAGSPGDMALVNLTPTSASAWGYGVLVSSDVPEPPNASNVNFDIGTLDPNVAAAPIGADGKVCYENSPLASVHLTADHLGTINAASFARATPTGASLRTLDTRNGAPVSPGGRICFDVAGSPGDMALVNLTPTSASAWGYGVLVSSDVPEPPNASNVNFDIGTLDPNVAAAPIGADGKVCYENSPLASVHLTADHLGTINAASFARATPTGASLRTLDTRNGAN